MLSHVVRRVLTGIVTLFAVTIVVFFMVTAVGDPLAELRSKPSVSQVTIKKLEQEFHLKDANGKPVPLVTRYVSWVGDLAQGDLGTSFHEKRPVTELLARAMWPTAQLFLGWLIVSFVIAVLVGAYSAIKPYTLGDRLASGASFVGFSAPVFFWAVLFQYYLAIELTRITGIKLFYVSGMVTPGQDTIPNRLSHLALPVMTLAIATIAQWSRYERSSMLDVIRADYIRTARAKGLSKWAVIMRHALRNALLPLVTVIGVEAGIFLGGAFVTEKVYSWPGMGRLFIKAIEQSDFPVVMGWLIVATIFVIVFGIITDVVYSFLDPRIRYD